MNDPRTEPERHGSGKLGVLLPYSVLGAGRRVDWEEKPEGIVIRVPPPPRPKNLHLVGIAGVVISLPLLLAVHRYGECRSSLVILPVVLVGLILFWVYGPFFAPTMFGGRRGMGRESRSEPLVLEVRAGHLFFHDPVAASMPGAVPWDLSLEYLVDLRIGSPPWPVKRSTRGQLVFVLPTKTLELLTGHEVGELQEILRLLQPWLKKAKNQEHFGQPAPQPLAARPRIEFVEDEKGFTVHIPIRPPKLYEAPAILRWMGRLVPLVVISVVILVVTAAGTNRPHLLRVAMIVFYIGFFAVVANIAGALLLSKLRGQTLRPQPSSPIRLDVQGDLLRRHDPNVLDGEVKVPIDQIQQVEAQPLTGSKRDEGMGCLHLVLSDGRWVELVARHDLLELAELEHELMKRIEMWKARRLSTQL